LIHETYRERWNTMVAELRAHPEVEVVEATLGRPVPDSVIAGWARDRGLPPTDELLGFYRFANWATLEWRVAGDWKYGGKIRIPSLEIAAQPAFWRGFGGPKTALDHGLDAYGLSLERAFDRVTPFDFFARSEDNIELAGMFARGDDIDVFVTEDDLACMTDTHLVSLGEYVDLLFRSYGATTARAALNGGAAGQARASEAIPGILSKRYSLDDLVELVRGEPNVEEIRQFFR
jgi:hypothetical protein